MKGSENSEGDFDDYAGGENIVKTIIEVADEGYDAVVIRETGDPFVSGIRECLDIPVIGPMEAALQLAVFLGNKFTLITPAKYMIPRKEKQVENYGFLQQLKYVHRICQFHRSQNSQKKS